MPPPPFLVGKEKWEGNESDAKEKNINETFFKKQNRTKGNSEGDTSKVALETMC